MYFQHGGTIILLLSLAGNAWGQRNFSFPALNSTTASGSISLFVSASSILPTPAAVLAPQEEDDDDDEYQIDTTQSLVPVSVSASPVLINPTGGAAPTAIASAVTPLLSLSGSGTGGAAPIGPATGAPFSNTTSAIQNTAAPLGTGTGSNGGGAAVGITAALGTGTGSNGFITGVGTAPGSGTGTGVIGISTSTGAPFGNNTATTAGTGGGGTNIGAVTMTESTIAAQTGIVISPIIIIVQQVTVFIFNSALGCLPPAVVPNAIVPGSFIVGQQPFPNLPAACSASCNQQLSVCISYAGPAFPVDDCQTQFTACINAAQQASQIPGLPVPATIYQTLVLPQEAATASPIGNMISNAGGSIINSGILPGGAVATVGNGGVSIITPTPANAAQMTPAIGAVQVVTESVTVTVTASDCASTVTLTTCPGSAFSPAPIYMSLATVTTSTDSATSATSPPVNNDDDDDDDDDQNGFGAVIRSLFGKRTGPSRSRIMRGMA